MLVWSFDTALLGGLVLCLLLCGYLACQAYRKTNASNPVTSQASWHFHGRVWLQCEAIECLMCVVWTWNVSMTTTPCNLEQLKPRSCGDFELVEFEEGDILQKSVERLSLQAAPSSSQQLPESGFLPELNRFSELLCFRSPHIQALRQTDGQMDRWAFSCGIVREWPDVKCLIAFDSKGFPLQKCIETLSRSHPV